MLTRYQTQPCCQLPGVVKILGISDADDQRGGSCRADPWNNLRLAADLVLAVPGFDQRLDLVDLPVQVSCTTTLACSTRWACRQHPWQYAWRLTPMCWQALLTLSRWTRAWSRTCQKAFLRCAPHRPCAARRSRLRTTAPSAGIAAIAPQRFDLLLGVRGLGALSMGIAVNDAARGQPSLPCLRSHASTVDLLWIP